MIDHSIIKLTSYFFIKLLITCFNHSLFVLESLKSLHQILKKFPSKSQDTKHNYHQDKKPNKIV
jgi:muconolactone delta-isomerase